MERMERMERRPETGRVDPKQDGVTKALITLS
jgi:hypothetical protein